MDLGSRRWETIFTNSLEVRKLDAVESISEKREKVPMRGLKRRGLGKEKIS